MPKDVRDMTIDELLDEVATLRKNIKRYEPKQINTKDYKKYLAIIEELYKE